MKLLIYLACGLCALALAAAFVQMRLDRQSRGYRVGEADKKLWFKLIRPIMEILASYNKDRGGEKLDLRYGKRLLVSGNPLMLNSAEFLALKQISAVGGFIVGLFFLLSFEGKYLLPFIFCISAYFLPNLWLHETTMRRKNNAFLSLPFAMDLMTMAMETGQSFGNAIDKVVQKGPPSVMRDEFALLQHDMKLGKTLQESLASLAERTDMYETRALCSALMQADRLGSPLAETLKVQAEIRRTERFLKAEKLAQEAPVKILFPLLFFIFPGVFIVLLMPVILKFMAEGM